MSELESAREIRSAKPALIQERMRLDVVGRESGGSGGQHTQVQHQRHGPAFNVGAGTGHLLTRGL